MHCYSASSPNSTQYSPTSSYTGTSFRIFYSIFSLHWIRRENLCHLKPATSFFLFSCRYWWMTKSNFHHANYSRICTRFEHPRGIGKRTQFSTIFNWIHLPDGEENSSAATCSFTRCILPHYFYITRTIGGKCKPDREGRLPPAQYFFPSPMLQKNKLIMITRKN